MKKLINNRINSIKRGFAFTFGALALFLATFSTTMSPFSTFYEVQMPKSLYNKE